MDFCSLYFSDQAGGIFPPSQSFCLTKPKTTLLFYSPVREMILHWCLFIWVIKCAFFLRSHFRLFCEGFVVGRNHTRWCGWWIALTFAIWKHRNLLIFQGIPFVSSKVMDDALFLAWSWYKARDKDFNIPFNHWSSNLMEAFG